MLTEPTVNSFNRLRPLEPTTSMSAPALAATSAFAAGGSLQGRMVQARFSGGPVQSAHGVGRAVHSYYHPGCALPGLADGARTRHDPPHLETSSRDSINVTFAATEPGGIIPISG